MTRPSRDRAAGDGGADPRDAGIGDALATLENCRYCLMCRHVDPLSHVTFDEALTPHGIALLVASQARGLIDWNDATVDAVFRELDNDNARAHCVTNQPFSDAVAAVKAHLVTMGAAPEPVLGLLAKLDERGAAFGDGAQPPANGKGDIALFVGDEAHALRPGTVDAAETLLASIGMAAIRIGRSRNSGLLASSLGLVDAARTLAVDHVEEIASTGAKRIVVLGPGDAFALRDVLPQRLGVTLPDGVEVVELTTLLAGALADGTLALAAEEPPGRFAYVDPTFAVRMPDRHEHPRTLVARVWGEIPVELFWRRERAHPVGSGAIRFLRPSVADALTRARLEDAVSRGAEVLVSDDPATLWQLDAEAGTFGLEVQGLFELLADRLR